MPTTYKVLGQVAPSTINNTDLYTVPAGTSAVLSAITVANKTATAYQYRIWIRVAGAAVDDKQILAYDNTCAGNDSVPWVNGITLGAGDVITVRSSNASSLTFQVFGGEITP